MIWCDVGSLLLSKIFVWCGEMRNQATLHAATKRYVEVRTFPSITLSKIMQTHNLSRSKK